MAKKYIVPEKFKNCTVYTNGKKVVLSKATDAKLKELFALGVPEVTEVDTEAEAKAKAKAEAKAKAKADAEGTEED